MLLAIVFTPPSVVIKIQESTICMLLDGNKVYSGSCYIDENVDERLAFVEEALNKFKISGDNAVQELNKVIESLIDEQEDSQEALDLVSELKATIEEAGSTEGLNTQDLLIYYGGLYNDLYAQVCDASVSIDDIDCS